MTTQCLDNLLLSSAESVDALYQLTEVSWWVCQCGRTLWRQKSKEEQYQKCEAASKCAILFQISCNLYCSVKLQHDSTKMGVERASQPLTMLQPLIIVFLHLPYLTSYVVPWFHLFIIL